MRKEKGASGRPGMPETSLPFWFLSLGALAINRWCEGAVS